VILVMAADTLNRFVAGVLVSNGIQLTTLLPLGPILMVIGHMMLAKNVGVWVLYTACIVIGLSDGICWSIGPLLVAHLFGLKAAGKIFGAIVLAAACFALLLSLGVEPAVYQQHGALPSLTEKTP
jgi:hypothetical protein